MITNKRTTFYVSLLLFIFIILYAGSAVEANSGGKYNSSNSCGSCHGSSSSSVTPTYSGFPTEYNPSQTYLVTIGMTQSASNAGFSFTVSDGSLSNPGPNTQVITKSATHTNSGATSWSFEWTAPPSGTGQVSLQVAVNLVDGGGTAGNDDWASISWTINEDVPTPTDTDGDGIIDDDDLCPNTPNGEAVNLDGCSESQLDDDGDGVFNDQDLCPNTPTGESVNSDRCSDSQLDLDSDGDGVLDSEDLCPNTPTGETVNSDGCSNSQLDSDGDGVSDADDQCEGFDDSIDVDNDQIIDGCDDLIDKDGDGVSNEEDQCEGEIG